MTDFKKIRAARADQKEAVEKDNQRTELILNSQRKVFLDLQPKIEDMLRRLGLILGFEGLMLTGKGFFGYTKPFSDTTPKEIAEIALIKPSNQEGRLKDKVILAVEFLCDMDYQFRGFKVISPYITPSWFDIGEDIALLEKRIDEELAKVLDSIFPPAEN